MRLTRIVLPLYLVLAATALPERKSLHVGKSSSVTPSARGTSSSIRQQPVPTGQHPQTTRGSRPSQPSTSRRPTHSSVSPHIKPSSTETSASTKPSTASNGLRTDYASLCGTNTRTQSMWKEFDMEGWTDYLANLIPSGKMSFLEYMKKNTLGVGELSCKRGKSCRLMGTGEDCNTTPPMTNPQNWAIIYSIVNFQDWIMTLLAAVDHAQADFNTMNSYLLATFTSHNFDLVATTWKNSIASGAATAFGAFLSLAKLRITGPVGDFLTLVGGIASLAGAGAVFATGVMGALVKQTVQVVENQLQEAGDMSLWLTQVFQGMRNGLVDGADHAINAVIHQGNGLGMYYGDTSGIVSWIKDGTFFDPIPDDFTVDLEAPILKSIFAAAVSSLWVQEEVYLVNTTSAWTYAWRDYESLNIDKKDITRVEYNGEIFFAIKHTKGLRPDQGYDTVPGIDKLANVNLTIQEVIAASAWSQSKVGFSKNWAVDQAMSFLGEGDPPPSNLFMNIPLCQLGQMPHPPMDLFIGTNCANVKVAAECAFKQYINWSCSKQIQITNGVKQPFPIDLFNPDWN